MAVHVKRIGKRPPYLDSKHGIVRLDLGGRALDFGRMCAQYTLKARAEELADRFDARLIPELVGQSFDLRVLPFRQAPVVVAVKSQSMVKWMRFHLTPKWSKEPKVKWATYNARLESIMEKASFRGAFKSSHCLVPISGFIEAVYEGPHAGHMVEFRPKDHRILWTAGIFDQWVDKESGEVLESFALLTAEPSRYVLEMGHDRQPIFVPEAMGEDWLNAERYNPTDWVKWLEAQPKDIEFLVREDRPLKPGWEKR